jgi:hypothetical protein
MRSIARGFALQRPSNEKLASVFDGLCDQREDVVAEGEEILLTIPQEPQRWPASRLGGSS